MTEFRISGQKNTELFCVKDVPPEAVCVVVIVHGFAEHCLRYGYVADRLYSEGCAVYRFDNRGHGQSKGKRMDVEDYRDFIEDTHRVVEIAEKDHSGLPVFMIGHSMGGFIAASYGIAHPKTLRGQILSGAATGQPEQMNWFLRLVVSAGSRIAPGLRVNSDLSGLLCRDNAVVQDYRNDALVSGRATLCLYDQFMIKGIDDLKNNLAGYRYPCLVLHGKDDGIINCKNSQYFVEHISSEDKTLRIYDGMYHEIFNEYGKESVLDDVVKWIKGRL